MTSDEALKLTQRAARIVYSSDAPTVNVDLTLPTIVGIVGCLQLSFRHPENTGPTRDHVERWLLKFIEKVDPSKGDVYKMLMLGFNTRFDDLLEDVAVGELFTIAVSCPECGKKGEEKTDNPAIVHKTRLCADCAKKRFSEPSDQDWENAFLHFDGVRKTYEALVNAPGVNTKAALEIVFKPLQERYDRGERSEELYNAMMEVE